MKTSEQVSRVMKFMKNMIAQRKGQFFSLIALRTITAVVPMITPRYYGRFVDTISQAGVAVPETVSILRWLLITIVARYMVDFIARRIIEYIIVKMETKTMRTIYTDCFDYLHRHSFRFFTENFSGALVKKVNKLVRGYETIVDVMIFDIAQVVVTLVVVVAVARNQSWTLGLGFLIWIIIYSILQYFMYRRVLPYDIAGQEQDSVVTGFLSDTITNHNNIDAFASLESENKKFYQTVELRRGLKQTAWMKQNRIYATNSGLMILGEFGVFAMIIRLWSQGKMDVTTVVALQLYILLLFQRIFFIGKSFKRVFDAIGESAEMIEILDEKHEIQDKANAKDMEVSKASVQFEDVHFSYNPERTIFAGLSLDIKSGEKVALVGPSGAGKSTISKLMLRLFDIQKGAIKIDGQNIAEVTQQSLRDSMSLVPQDPILFHRSLRDNIAYGKQDASDQEIIKAAKMARCHDFITSLPEGYDTFVGERGVKLSGGERQRVAIARAILEDKKILIMDEATSSLDSESEKLIQEAIHEVIQNKTAIIIAHRLSTIKEMDRIIVLEKGKIIEQGTHQELLNTSGMYDKLRKIQAS